jgi:rSAM/selenodomain-associated transferase 2
MISVIVPIKDEPPEIVLHLARFAASAGCELIVVEGAGDSPAGELLRSAGARLVVCRGSRGSRLARAVLEARGDVLFFLHADSRPPDDALELIRQTLDRGCSAGAFSLAYEDADFRMRWIASWANLRSRLFRLPFGDQGIFCRRQAYEAAGGFRDMPVCDDVDLVRRLRRSGRFVVRPEATRTSSRRYRERGAFRQVLRVWGVVGGYYIGVSPEKLGRWYYGSGS